MHKYAYTTNKEEMAEAIKAGGRSISASAKYVIYEMPADYSGNLVVSSGGKRSEGIVNAKRAYMDDADAKKRAATKKKAAAKKKAEEKDDEEKSSE